MLNLMHTYRYFILAAFLFAGILSACKKKDATGCSASACPAISAIAPPLSFNYIDSLMNRDQFWTNPRQYGFQDLVVFKKKNATDTIHIPYLIDSVSVPARFTLQPRTTLDTFYVQVLSQKVDTIMTSGRPVSNDCCVVGYIYGNVFLNGKVNCAICPLTQIVDIRR